MNREELIQQPNCSFACPPLGFSGRNGIPGCCEACPTARKEFAAQGGLPEFGDEDKAFIREQWDDTYGFVSAAGCKLPRRLYPTECLEYDCREYKWYFAVQWHPGAKEWMVVSRMSIPLANITQEFLNDYHDVFDAVKRKK